MRRKKENKKGIWFSLFLVAILVFSVGGYLLGEGEEKLTYGDYTFIASPGGYLLKVNSYPVAFTYFPEQLESLYFPEEISGMISGRPMFYVTYDPKSSIAPHIASAQFRMQAVLANTVNIYLQPALTSETNFTLQKIDCKNATAFVPVILFKESNTTNVTMEGGCILIDAEKGTNVLAYSERIMYLLLGVME